MQTVIGNEILKTYRKWRSYIAFLAIGIIIPLVQVAMKLQGGNVAESATRGLSRDFLLVGNILNCYFITYMLMNSLWIHIPFLLTLAAGDMLAGEATGGTFRLLLIRPVSRSAILTAKYLTTLLYTATVVLFLAGLSVGLGAILFGTGDLLIPGRSVVLIPESDALWRLGVAVLLAIWGMWTVSSLAFLFSALVENALGPIIATMAVLIVSYVIGNIRLDLFEAIRPYLFTTYLNVWDRAMQQPIPWDEILRSAGVLGAYSIGFFGLAWYIFVRKDILS